MKSLSNYQLVGQNLKVSYFICCSLGYSQSRTSKNPNKLNPNKLNKLKQYFSTSQQYKQLQALDFELDSGSKLLKILPELQTYFLNSLFELQQTYVKYPDTLVLLQLFFGIALVLSL
ncbi:Hypothetical_protein [Hexamita inflata]|uniref:Hypothetical_protein n=1 Tax=Hexamita inflata TaxID=28002 RepID=A0AA86TX51_9EUKA|nr:Hypothetical protein HINF_LOCUS11564 [Hexamita inflata]CAI9924358.1 Hypothetical protein HINF_LOCUS12003 [Hexamita inflata]CAI9925544.1 Hypothetical protein HINF_LOCUS13189 [Hexamita inflata]